jgi:3-phosphoshikimate 1-carboxyvinyltransferase
LAALQAELTKLGAVVTVEQDTLQIEPPDKIIPAAIDTYEDHRMAMSFAVAGTRAEGITIRGIECTAKTYPGFFDDLKATGAMNEPIAKS